MEESERRSFRVSEAPHFGDLGTLEQYPVQDLTRYTYERREHSHESVGSGFR